MFSFELDGPVGARQIYLQRWKAIAALITENRLDEASAKIEALVFSQDGTTFKLFEFSKS
jgi:hypothetical protein